MRNTFARKVSPRLETGSSSPIRFNFSMITLIEYVGVMLLSAFLGLLMTGNLVGVLTGVLVITWLYRAERQKEKMNIVMRIIEGLGVLVLGGTAVSTIFGNLGLTSELFFGGMMLALYLHNKRK